MSIQSQLFSHRRLVIVSLRYALAIIFIWFGVLKIMGYNPVYDLIYNSMVPMLAAGWGLKLLGIFEVVVGVLLSINKWRNFTHFLLLMHMLGTFSSFVFGWGIVFDPYFPVLSLAGEFVVKNIILILAALTVLLYEKNN